MCSIVISSYRLPTIVVTCCRGGLFTWRNCSTANNWRAWVNWIFVSITNLFKQNAKTNWHYYNDFITTPTTILKERPLCLNITPRKIHQSERLPNFKSGFDWFKLMAHIMSFFYGCLARIVPVVSNGCWYMRLVVSHFKTQHKSWIMSCIIQCLC